MIDHRERLRQSLYSLSKIFAMASSSKNVPAATGEDVDMSSDIEDIGPTEVELNLQRQLEAERLRKEEEVRVRRERKRQAAIEAKRKAEEEAARKAAEEKAQRLRREQERARQEEEARRNAEAAGEDEAMATASPEPEASMSKNVPRGSRRCARCIKENVHCKWTKVSGAYCEGLRILT
jgi:hypothetical protein